MFLVHLHALAAMGSLVFASQSSLSRRVMVLHQRRDSAPDGFVSQGPAPYNAILNLRFALAQNNFSGLESTLYDVSTPGSSRYKQFLSKEEVWGSTILY